MKILLCIFAFCLTLILHIKAESYVPNSVDKNNPNDCYHKELKLSIKLGESIKPVNMDICGELVCQEPGLIRVNECGRVLSSCANSQYVATDFTKAFPACCEHYKCP